MKRSSGLLLHPVSLPSKYGIGTIGKAARDFIEFLAAAGQHVWQILPLSPTGYGNSPYNALSAFAGNPLLIDLDDLIAVGDLCIEDLQGCEHIIGQVDYPWVYAQRQLVFKKACERFNRLPQKHDRRLAFAEFCAHHSEWLDDYALFMVLRQDHEYRPWSDWPELIKLRDRTELTRLQAEKKDLIHYHKYLQFVFNEQWQDLRAYAREYKVIIFGDLPIFVAYDSADVWAHRELFQLNDRGQPMAVAGVPPDYFSATGQLWGNPLYNWDKLLETGFKWWLDRFNCQLQMADIIRIDHFRGFQACWSVAASERTAVNGHWEDVPGELLFETLCKEHPAPPIVAEDLGVITPEVEALRDRFRLPGMKVLQFAFDSGPDNPHLPHNHPTHCVVYTGTHDNNTTVGWWRSLDEKSRQSVKSYLKKPRPEIPWDIIELAMESVAELCIVPCQDILALDQSARFNRPGRANGNWRWRLGPMDLNASLAERLAKMTEKHKRKRFSD